MLIILVTSFVVVEIMFRPSCGQNKEKSIMKLIICNEKSQKSMAYSWNFCLFASIAFICCICISSCFCTYESVSVTSVLAIAISMMMICAKTNLQLLVIQMLMNMDLITVRNLTTCIILITCTMAWYNGPVQFYHSFSICKYYTDCSYFTKFIFSMLSKIFFIHIFNYHNEFSSTAFIVGDGINFIINAFQLLHCVVAMKGTFQK